MSTAGVKAIPFRKLLVKWIDNGNTYFKYFNSIVAQMLNTVMQHLLSRSTGVSFHWRISVNQRIRTFGDERDEEQPSSSSWCFFTCAKNTKVYKCYKTFFFYSLFYVDIQCSSENLR